MENETNKDCCEKGCCSKKANYSCGAAGGGVYCLGLIGAAIFYLQNASGFWPIILAILKALVWPAFLVYQLLQFLK